MQAIVVQQGRLGSLVPISFCLSAGRTGRPRGPWDAQLRTVATPAMTPQIKSQHGERWRGDGETRREALPFKMESSALIPLFFS